MGTKDSTYKPIPNEPLWTVFTPKVIGVLRRVQNPSDPLKERLGVFDASGLNSHDRTQMQRAYMAAWECYLAAAFACGLFEEPHGADLRARLTGTDDNNFRSAMSECMGTWYLAGSRKLRVEPRPEGRPGHLLEFVIKLPDGDVNVEVKAPYRAVPEGYWRGDDADLLQSALQKANKQFRKGDRNLLIMVPRLPISIFGSDLLARQPLERAFIGEEVIRVPINPRTGGPAGPVTFPFRDDSGDFTKSWPPAQSNTNWEPRHTRVSATLTLGDYPDGPVVKHRALMVHNPNAVVSLKKDAWLGIPEFFRDRGQWRWSDRPVTG